MTTSKIREVIENIDRPASVISIDASTNSLAFSYFVNGKLVRYGKIRFNGSDAIYKAGDAAKKCIPFFKSLKADALVIESAIYSNSAKTAMQLSLVQGAIIGSAQVAGIKTIKTIAPMTWQNHISNGLLSANERQEIAKQNPGKSKSWYKSKERETRKNKTIKYVNVRFNIVVSDDDVADAIGIGACVSDRWQVFFERQSE